MFMRECVCVRACVHACMCVFMRVRVCVPVCLSVAKIHDALDDDEQFKPHLGYIHVCTCSCCGLSLC